MCHFDFGLEVWFVVRLMVMVVVGREHVRGGVQDTCPICYFEEKCLIYNACGCFSWLVLLLVLLWYVVHVCFVVRKNAPDVGRVMEVVKYVLFLIKLRGLEPDLELVVLIPRFLFFGGEGEVCQY